MNSRRGRLGDLPHDIGTDHRQMFGDPSEPGQALNAPAEQTRSGVTAGLARWLVGALIPYLFPSLKFSVRPFSAGLESDEVSGSKASRRYLLIQNNSVSDMYINFGSDAGPTSSLIVKAGGYYEPYRVPADSIYISAASGASQGILIEG